MGLKELRAEIDDEVATLLGKDFAIQVTKTLYVPHAGDPAITFPDITERSQGTKLIETCVLYIDIRRSTELNFSHKPRTVAKLYSAFVRSMTRVARYYEGHVRGIIGDRVMVIFDHAKCYANAVNCAIAMNTVAKYIINKHFKANEVSCGIGIDAGKMLATKTGVRRHGQEQANYRNLVWLGRPANIASKLTDLANKPAETKTMPIVQVAYNEPVQSGLLGLGSSFGSLGLLGSSPATNLFMSNQPQTEWKWKTESLEDFVSRIEVQYVPSRLVHKDSKFASFCLSSETRERRAATPPILMTASVWKGFREEHPDDPVIKKGLIKRIRLRTPGNTEAVFGGDVIFTSLKPA